MPVPTRRLVLLSLLVLPVAGASLWSPTLGAMVGLVGLLMLGAALLDGMLQRNGIPPVELESRKEVRLAKYRDGEWVLHLIPARSVRGLRIGVAFPAELGAERDEENALRVERDSPCLIRWAMRPTQRGSYRVQDVVLAEPSPLGFWEFRWTIPLQTEFKVHPDLSRERNVLANLFLNRGLTGMRAQRLAGRGRDYDQIREYQLGDTPNDIHWKATAKRHELMSKSHQIERTQEVYIVVDHSRLSGRPQPFADGAPAEPVLERFVAAANVLAMAALREGDLFGFMAFARNTDRFVRAGSGTAHLRVLQNALYQLESEPVYPDLDEWIRFTRTRVRRRSLLVLLTDLSDATTFELLEQRIGLLARTHVVVVAMIPMPGVEPLFHRTASDADPWRSLAGHLMWRDLNGYRKRLRALGVPLLLPTADRLAVEVVDQYLKLKQQQRL